MKSYKRVIIKQFSGIWSVFMLLFFMPASYIIGGRATRIINLLLIVGCLLFIGAALWVRRYGYSPKRTTGWIVALYSWCCFGSSLLNNLRGYPIDAAYMAVSLATAILFVLLCDIGLWYNPRKTLKIFLVIGVLACSINAVTILLYRDSGGLNPQTVNIYGGRMSQNYYFLGEDNASYFWSWPVLVVAWFYYYMYNRKMRMKILCYAYTALLIVSYLYTWSLLSMIACISVPVTLLLLVRNLNRVKRNIRKTDKNHFSFNLMWIAAMGFNVLLSAGVIMSYLTPFVSTYLRKDATLSRRTFIWERSYVAIYKSPLIGYGFEPTEVSYTKILINHTHNLVLETLYRGGIIGMILFCGVMLTLSRESAPMQNHVLHKYLKIMVFLFLVYSSMYFAFYRYHYLILFVLLSYLGEMIGKQENWEEKTSLAG